LEREELLQLQRQLERRVREHFPGAPIQRVALFQHEDEPQVEPSALLGRVYLEVPADPAERERTLEVFHDTYRQAVHDLRDVLDVFPEAGTLEFVVSDGGGGHEPEPVFRLASLRRDPEPTATTLVPVMARLGPAELETVDTLITAGIAANRAEAIRWALTRIRERPAYRQLQEHVRDIAELKDQF
jgi:hypothetical protein